MLALLSLMPGWMSARPAPQKDTGIAKPYVERSEKQFAFFPGGKVEVSALAPGSVRITGWENSSLRVEIERVFFYASPDQAQALAAQFPVRVTNTRTSARISTTGTARPSAVMEVNVSVYVPREKTDLNIRIVKGALSVVSLNGSIEATIEEGNVEAKELAGYFSAITKRGTLSVELSGPRWRGYGLTAATRQGSVELKLPPDYSAALQLDTKNGNIYVDYPDQVVEGESVPLKVAAKKNARSLSAPIGLGGTAIRLMTYSGDIVFKSTDRARLMAPIRSREGGVLQTRMPLNTRGSSRFNR